MLELDANGFLDAAFWKHFSKLADCDYLDFIKPRSRQLTFTDLAGIFYVMAMGLGTSMVVLVCEWLVAAFADINTMKRERPKFLKDALKIRWRRLLLDVRINWFPLSGITQKWKKVELPVLTEAEAILESQLHKDGRKRRSELQTTRTNVDNPATLLSERKQDIWCTFNPCICTWHVCALISWMWQWDSQIHAVISALPQGKRSHKTEKPMKILVIST